MVTQKKIFSPQLFVAILLVALSLVTYLPKKTQAAPASNPNKITICHRTHATTNPYRRITVNKTSIFNGQDLNDPNDNGNGHGRFQHNDWPGSDANPVTARPVPNVYDPTVTYAPNKKRWGDIIPDRLDNGTQINSRTAMPLNYTGAGLAIYNNTSYNGNAAYANMCKRKSAKEYCDAEVAALVADGMTQSAAESSCMTELQEQGALDDAALLSACGNDISTCSFAALSIYGTSTGQVTCSGGNITFNGTTNMASASGTPTFEYGASTALGTSEAASPSTVTGAVSFSATISLADGTYYYRAVVTTADEGEIAGTVETFTKSSSTCSGTATTTTSTSSTSTSTSTTSTTVASSSTSTSTSTSTSLSTSTSTSSSTSTTNAPMNINSATSTTAVQVSSASSTTTSTSSTITTGQYTGALRGIVWIDKNLNELQDSDEPGLPFTPVVATLTISYVGGPVGTQVTTKTDALGKYSVAKLEPGKWDVYATLTTDALSKTFDTDDGLGVQGVRAASVGSEQPNSNGVSKSAVIDWQAKATVPVNGLGIADFAAAGDAILKVAIEVPAACVKSEFVEMTWAGLDLKLGTSDDATFVVKVADKEAVAKRIPYGNYTVTPICTSGVRLVGEQLVLRKKQTRAVTVKAAILPATGQQNSRILIQAGLALVLVGMVLAKRRKVIS